MLSSTASTSTFLAEKICVLENDIDRIKEKMGEIENVYPRIYLGECSKKSTLKNLKDILFFLNRAINDAPKNISTCHYS